MNKYVIGIDLGTTNSCVAVLQHGKVEVIPNEQGNRTTPSCVAFNETERFVGEGALNQAALNPTNTVFEAKRLIGKKFCDVSIEKSIKTLPFKVVDLNEKAAIQVEYKQKMKTFYPEEVSSMVLSNMKDIAQAYLGVEVSDAVITVPAYFSDSQRQSTRDAGSIAGLHVVSIINEPTAAAIAYGLEKCTKEREYILVFDLGGGTFDVSILAVENENFHVLATSGDAHLGGEDFDSLVVQHCAKVFQRRYQIDISKNTRCLRRLKNACEKAKRLLSTASQASIQIEAVVDGIDFNTTISRALFENICYSLFKKTLTLVQKALGDSKLKKSEIDTVVLVGGSTRIPKIQTLLKDFFNQKELNKSIHPDEAVAIGAASHGATFSRVGNAPFNIENMSLYDVIPHSIGVSVEGNVMDVLLPCNSLKPSVVNRSYTTCYDDQSVVKIEVYEGEEIYNENNNLLAHFQLRDIPPMAAGLAEIKVTFEIDMDGILNVTAVEESTGAKRRMTVKNKDRLSTNELDRMAEEADARKAEDQRIREKIKLKNSLEETIFRVQDLLDEGMVAKHHLFRTSQVVNDFTEWLTENDRSASIRELEYHNKTMILLEKEILTDKDLDNTVNSMQLKGDDIKGEEKKIIEMETKEIRELKNDTVHKSKNEFKEQYSKVVRLQEKAGSDSPTNSSGSERLKPIEQLKTELIGFANQLQEEVNSVHLSYETRNITNAVIQQALKWLNTTESTSILELNYFERTLQTHRDLISEELKCNEKEVRRNPTDELPSEIYYKSKEKLPMSEEPIYDEIKPLQNEEQDSFQQDVYNVPKPLPSLSDIIGISGNNNKTSIIMEKQFDKEDDQGVVKYEVVNEFSEKDGCLYQNVYANAKKTNEEKKENANSGSNNALLSKSQENSQDKIMEIDYNHDLSYEDPKNINDEEKETSSHYIQKIMESALKQSRLDNIGKEISDIDDDYEHEQIK